jgi:5-methyltetrahydrofolate--homocysteine methyltransferase
MTQLSNTARELVEAVKSGDENETSSLVRQMLSDGADPYDILYGSLLLAMNEIGDNFNTDEVFIAEVLNAAQAWKKGYSLLKNVIVDEGSPLLGRVVIATVEGDVHDIGKNLVSVFLDAAGFEIIDLGVDVSADMIVDAVREYRPDILALSSLLTVTMKYHEVIIQALKDAGLRDGLIIFVGGAPITREYSREIGADFYEKDAASAAEHARKLFAKRGYE